MFDRYTDIWRDGRDEGGLNRLPDKMLLYSLVFCSPRPLQLYTNQYPTKTMKILARGSSKKKKKKRIFMYTRAHKKKRERKKRRER